VTRDPPTEEFAALDFFATTTTTTTTNQCTPQRTLFDYCRLSSRYPLWQIRQDEHSSRLHNDAERLLARQKSRRVIDGWRLCTGSVVCAGKSRGEKLRKKTKSTNDFAADLRTDGPVAGLAKCVGYVLGTIATKFAVFVSIIIIIIGNTQHY
jgi:hypothetical protein